MNTPINTRDEEYTSPSIEEIIKNRENELKGFEYDAKYDSTIHTIADITQEHLKYDNIQDYKNDDNLNPLSKEDDIKYILECNNTAIPININGMLECDPPILTFENNHCDNYIPIDNDIYNKWSEDILTEPLSFKIIIKNNEFKYVFNKVTEFTSESKIDERYDKIRNLVPNSSKFHNETEFIQFTIDKDTYPNMFNDDTYRNLIFAKYDNKIIFRQGKFRMIRDGLYNEMEALEWNI